MLIGVSADSFIMPGVVSIHRQQHAAAEELLRKTLETSLLLPLRVERLHPPQLEPRAVQLAGGFGSSFTSRVSSNLSPVFSGIALCTEVKVSRKPTFKNELCTLKHYTV